MPPATVVAVAAPDLQVCLTVEPTMLDVPRAGDQEPRLRVPMPEGWKQPEELGTEDGSIRLAILNPPPTVSPRDAQAIIDCFRAISAN